MAHSNSAKKRIRQNEKRKNHNKTLRSSAKTAVKKVVSAVEDKNLEQAQKALPLAMKQLDKVAKKHIFHPNNTARKKSRLCKMVGHLEATQDSSSSETEESSTEEE